MALAGCGKSRVSTPGDAVTPRPYATDAGLAGIAGSPTESAAPVAAQGRMGLVVVKFFDRDGACLTVLSIFGFRHRSGDFCSATLPKFSLYVRTTGKALREL